MDKPCTAGGQPALDAWGPHYDPVALPNGFWYGPSLQIMPTGVGRSAGRDLATIPPGQWARVEIRATVGERAQGRHSVLVMPPGEAGALRFDDLPHPAEFRVLNWIGWMAEGAPGAVFYIDNLQVRPVTP